MSHQHSMYMDSSNPSPDLRHVGYGAVFQPGLSLPRHAQRQPLYPSDQLSGGYNPRVLDQMPGLSQGLPQGLPGQYMMDNSQSWSYNGGNVATIGGAINGPGRQSAVNRRSQLPPAWQDSSAPLPPPFPGANFAHSPLNGLRMDLADARSSGPANDDQLIPTAIVIKNIPFAVRKETLADIMAQMNLPTPYAFNYHFDNGVFRGLAFANFSSPDDTRLVIEHMNGLEVANRKLRVEYKKMLPEAERERIEREKRERRGQLEEQHRGPLLHSQPSLQSLASMNASSNQPTPMTSHLGKSLGTPTAGAGAGPRSHGPEDIDLNDPKTLEFYTELTLFQRDENREILIFPSTTSPDERRQVHILAHNMGLGHQSVGDADNRQIHVIKRRIPSPTARNNISPLDMNKRGLSRAATFDFADQNTRATSLNYGSHGLRHGPTLEVPGSPDAPVMQNSLRTAKSFADLRSFSPTPSQASSSYLGAVAVAAAAAAGNASSSIGGTPTNATHFGNYTGISPSSNSMMTPSLTPTTSNQDLLINTFGGLNLSNDAPSRGNPGTIGSQRPGQTNRSAPERQPRGPEWESSSGFGRRVNGHATQGSGMPSPRHPLDALEQL